MNSTLPVWLFLTPFLAALFIGIAGWRRPAAARGTALAALAATAGLAGFAAALASSGETLVAHMGGWPPPLGIEWRLDALGAFVAALVATMAFVQVGAARDVVRLELPGREPGYYVCALLLVSGLMGIAASADLFNLFVHIEVASLSAAALVAAGGRGAPRAALRYLVMGSLGASIYLLGVGHVYAATGTLNMADAAEQIRNGASPTLAVVGLGLMAGGLAVKAGIFPLHGWMPDAYGRAPLAAAALMAPIVTKVGAYALLRILFWVYGPYPPEVVLEVLCGAGGAALVAGALLAACQNDLRRMFVYSSVSQMGLVAMGIGIANRASMTGAILHLANDALMKGALFLGAAVLASRLGIRDVAGLSRARSAAPWTAAAMAVAALSLVGLPPLCGFFGKWLVLTGALEAGRPVLAAAVVAGSLASAVYAFRMIERLYFRPAEPSAVGREGPAGLVAATAVLGFAVVAFGLANEKVVALIVRAALPGGM